MKTIVISGINLFEGGTLSIYKDCLDNIIKCKLNETNNIIALVHKKEIFTEYVDKITIVELPKSRKNYLYRMFYEYIYFYFYSKSKNIDVWLSLHDITPNVKANNKYVYCHNPSPFMKTEIKNLKYSYKNFLFSLFYKYLYKINIKKNTAVIVQQDWMRKEFIKMYNLKNVIVARPTININDNNYINHSKERKKKFQFIYAAFPRFFKNFEIICEACVILEGKGLDNFEVLLTLDGTENKYAHELTKKYLNYKTIKFIGLQGRANLFSLYEKVDCMIFPSKLETWGLPISEFKGTGKPLLVADLPYAHETVGSYNKICFFDPLDKNILANLMENEIYGENRYINVIEGKVGEPFAANWIRLFDMIF